jgi:hypothetical protein
MDKQKAKALNYLYNNSVPSSTGCREWTGPVTKDGYGQIGPDWIVIQFGIKGAHRLMVHLVHGHEFTSRHETVMHRCHNRACVNPEHLDVGDQSLNMQEAARRGSMAKKLTVGDVILIRSLGGSASNSEIAARFGVHCRTIDKVLQRIIWKHVPS